MERSLNPCLKSYQRKNLFLLFGFTLVLSWWFLPTSQTKSQLKFRVLSNTQYEYYNQKLKQRCIDPNRQINKFEPTLQRSPNISYVITTTVTNPPFNLVSHPSASDILSGRLQKFGYSWDTDSFSEIFSNIIKYDDSAIILDVGANIGLVSLLAASSGLNVYSVEPNPDNYLKFETSIGLNCLENYITLYRNAASEKSGNELTLYVHDLSPGLSTLVEPQKIKQGVNRKRFSYSHTVKTITIDEIIHDIKKEHPGKKVEFMKIDVEGHEYQALQGGKESLKNKDISILHIEIFPSLLEAAGTNPIDLLNFLTTFDYRASLIPFNNTNPQWISDFEIFLATIPAAAHTDLFW